MDSDHTLLSENSQSVNGTPHKSDVCSDKSAKHETLEKKSLHLRLMLEKDFKAADLRWSLFVAAALSFRYETCLKPFPPAFLNNGVKNMDELLALIAEVPALDLMLKRLNDLDHLEEIGPVLDLLFYVLVRLKEPTVKCIQPEAHDSVLLLLNSTLPAIKPHHIFQVVSSPNTAAELKWNEMTKYNNTFYASYGNKLDNFYSILQYGLQHVNKNTSIGNGVYLSQELGVSLPHSHCGYGWGASCLGGRLSCVAMCEVIDAPDGINLQRPSCEGDIAGDDEKKLPPQSHYIVTNYDLVRVRYLLVYARQPIASRFPSIAKRQADGMRHWFTRHKLFSILLGYGIMLATIGFANNQPMNYYYGFIMKKLDFALQSINS